MRFYIMVFRTILVVSLLNTFLFSATCSKTKILGVFPKISGFSCNEYALFIGFVGIISASLFWKAVTK